MDRFDEMRTFVRVVEAGGISAAAERMAIAKSAVSRRLQELENRLGAQLLLRTTRRISLTDAGRAFYERCLRILDEVEEAELSVSSGQSQVHGTLRVAAPLSFTVRHLTPLIAEFLQRYPGVRLDLDVNDRQINIIEEGVDLTIRIGNLGDSSLIARRLTPIRAVLCASPGYLAEHGEPTSLEALNNHQGLAYGHITEQRQWTLLDKAGNRHIVRPTVRLRANNGDLLLDAAVAGLGVAVIPTFIGHRKLADGHLKQLLPDYEPEQSAAYALYPSRRHLPRRVRVFIDFLVERLGDTPGWERDIPQRRGNAAR